MEISEAEAIAIAGDAEGDVLAEETNPETDSSVCLRKFPTRFILGASCDVTDTTKFYVFDDLDAAQVLFNELAVTMRRMGTPFGAAS
jgi:hypothetical protein